MGGVDPASYRAGDADRERVAERLRVALEEGRLNLHEYDERLGQAYAARTYADLDALVADIPGAAPASGSLTPAAPAGAAARWQQDAGGRYPDATRRWLAQEWSSWIPAVAVCVAIWAVASVLGAGWTYFWPGWVAGPWGALLLVRSIRGLLDGEPQRWAAKQARKEGEREVRRRAIKRELAPDADAQEADTDPDRD
jgi:hypothetical protein